MLVYYFNHVDLKSFKSRNFSKNIQPILNQKNRHNTRYLCVERTTLIMSKKNLIEKNEDKLKVQENAHNILFTKKKYFYPNKIDKTIEIVIVPKLADITANQKNVGIVLDEKLILEILSKHYSNVSITEINTENDLKKLALRKPDLVFSGVKYFYFADGIIWLNDYLELNNISYIASNRAALHNEHDKSIAKKIIQKAILGRLIFSQQSLGSTKMKCRSLLLSLFL